MSDQKKTKFGEFLSVEENRRMEFLKDEEGNVHMVDRMATSQGHFRKIKMADGKIEKGYVSEEEFEKMKKEMEPARPAA